jgi:hypothetical protein
MTLKHTMTLTDDQAHLLHKWAKKELEKDDAVAAAWVLKGLIDAHILEWAQNKWEWRGENRVRTRIVEPGYTAHDEDALAERLAPILEKDTIKVIPKGWVGVAMQGRISTEDFVTIWNHSNSRDEVYEALKRHLPDTDMMGWRNAAGMKEVRRHLSAHAARLRKAGWEIKKLKRGRPRKQQVDEPARSTRT